MRSTIDSAGRVVIPKAFREQVGLVAGAVELTVDHAGVRVEPVADDGLLEKDGRLVIPATGESFVDDDLVRALRDADRR